MSAKKHVFGSSVKVTAEELPNSCLRVGCHCIKTEILHLTGRWYGQKSVGAQRHGAVFAPSRAAGVGVGLP